jgi:hypothetical protein
MKAAPLSPPALKAATNHARRLRARCLLALDSIRSVALAFAKQGQLNLWLASTAIYGNQSPSVPTTEKTLNKVASLTRSISGDHLSTGVARKISLDQPLSAYWIDPGSQRQSLAQVADAVAKAIAL